MQQNTPDGDEVPQPDPTGNTNIQVAATEVIPVDFNRKQPYPASMSGIMEQSMLSIDKGVANKLLFHGVNNLERENAELKDRVSSLEAKLDASKAEVTELKIEKAELRAEVENKALYRVATVFGGGCVSLAVFSFTKGDLIVASSLGIFGFFFYLFGLCPHLFKKTGEAK